MNPKKGKTTNAALRPFASLSMIPQSVDVCVCVCIVYVLSACVCVCLWVPAALSCFCASFDRPDVYSVLNVRIANLVNEEDQKVSNMNYEHDNSIHTHLQNERPSAPTSTIMQTNNATWKIVLCMQFEQDDPIIIFRVRKLLLNEIP